jgi:hypothetical protein
MKKHPAPVTDSKVTPGHPGIQTGVTLARAVPSLEKLIVADQPPLFSEIEIDGRTNGGAAQIAATANASTTLTAKVRAQERGGLSSSNAESSAAADWSECWGSSS